MHPVAFLGQPRPSAEILQAIRSPITCSKVVVTQQFMTIKDNVARALHTDATRRLLNLNAFENAST